MAEGIILGAVAGEVLRAILEIKERAVAFSENLEQLQNTLEHVIPLFVEGRMMDLELNDRKRKGLEKLIGKLRKGEELVQKCSKVPSWNIYLKIRYSSRIMNLDDAIVRFCQRELQVEIWHDNKQLQRNFQQLLIKMEGLTTQQGLSVSVGVPSIGNEGLFAVPGLPDHVVGFDIPLKELKNELFKENVTVLGLCAPGGCGKSTLAAMLCRDEEVRGMR